eukprot:c32424_g1_i1 orf=1-192(-)
MVPFEELPLLGIYISQTQCCCSIDLKSCERTLMSSYISFISTCRPLKLGKIQEELVRENNVASS